MDATTRQEISNVTRERMLEQLNVLKKKEEEIEKMRATLVMDLLKVQGDIEMLELALKK